MKIIGSLKAGMNGETNHGLDIANAKTWWARLWRVNRPGIIGVLVLSIAPAVGAGEPLQYNQDVRPILADNCFACHGADSAARKADLRIDQRDAAIEFGAIVPGSPDDSELISRIETDDPDLLMPPPETKKRLTVEQREILRRWIDQGAGYQPIGHSSRHKDLTRRRSTTRLGQGTRSIRTSWQSWSRGV